jgi:hypothetical protein
MNPLRLLGLERSKFFPSTTFRVFIFLYAGFFSLVVLLARTVGHNMTMNANGETTHPLANIFNYPNNWELLACIGSWMNLFVLGTLGVFMITMEFSNKTLRQSVIFGMTRLEVAVSKLIWAVALSLGATAFYIILAFGGETFDGGFGLPPVGCVVGFFVQALGYLFLGNLVGLLIRQTALAVLAYLAYVIFLETACKWIFYFSVAKTRLLLFLPDQVLGALTPMPVPKSVGEMVSSNPFLTPLTLTDATVAALVYLALFGLFFCRRITKADL